MGKGTPAVEPAFHTLRHRIYEVALAHASGTCTRDYLDPTRYPHMTFPPHIKWCGLFAAWVWRQANVGVYFKTEEKRKPGGYGGIWRQSPDQYLGSSGRLKFLDMGDIIVFQPGPYHDENGKVKNGRNHHAIIIATYEDGAVVDMVEGNATGPKGDDPKTNIVQFTPGYDFRIKKKEEKQFYSVDTFMDPKVRY